MPFRVNIIISYDGRGVKVKHRQQGLKCMNKFNLELDAFVCGYLPQILLFSFSRVTLKFSFRNTFFKTRLLLKIFDAEFPYKRSYFEPLCRPAKMAAETVSRSILYRR